LILRDYAVNHQGELHRLNIAVDYRYAPGIADSADPD
jgi:hypothetical protein